MLPTSREVQPARKKKFSRSHMSKPGVCVVKGLTSEAGHKLNGVAGEIQGFSPGGVDPNERVKVRLDGVRGGKSLKNGNLERWDEASRDYWVGVGVGREELGGLDGWVCVCVRECA